MSKVTKDGTIVTAGRTSKADVLYHAVLETAEIVE